MDPRLSKWLRWFEVIKVEVQDLVVTRRTFHEIQTMIADNPKLKFQNSFYSYLTSTYVSHIAMGLRRQIKSDSQCISFVLLLNEMFDTPEVLTRQYFLSLYQGTGVEEFAHADFDKLAGKDAPHIDPELVATDIERLKKATSKCEDLADKRVAHRDKREPRELPTFGEIDDCIDLLDKLYVRYFLLFRGKSMESLLPTRQYNWQEIFRTPWIPGNT